MPRTSLLQTTAMVALFALVAAGCSSSTSVGESVEQATTLSPTVAQVEPTAVAPTTDSSPDETGAETPGESTEADPIEPLPERETVTGRADSLLGIGTDGRFAYAGTTSPWNTQTACDAAPAEALAVIDLETADTTAGVAPISYAGGLMQAGDVRQLVFGEGSRVAIVSTCGPLDDPKWWLQRADLAEDGSISAFGAVVPLAAADNETSSYVSSWIDADTVEVQVVVETDPDDFESWVFEDRSISTVTGERVTLAQRGYYDDPDVASGPDFRTPDGRFVYRAIEDPDGSVGCEGFGIAVAIELESNGERSLALGPDGLVFSNVSGMHFGPDGLASWTTGCEGFTTAYVGRIADDGTIVDAHWIDTYASGRTDPDEYVEWQSYRLTQDGDLIALGGMYDGETDGELRIARFDLSTDPQFVESAAASLDVDASQPLGETLEGYGSWLVGNTLSADPACGAKTLYGQTTTGLARAFDTDFEVDTIVDLDVSETRTISYEDFSYETRSIVIQTECPDEYEGRLIWFGEEPDRVRSRMYLQQAAIGAVADVLSVRESTPDDDPYPLTVYAQVVLLDGTTTEIELIPLDG